MTNRILRRMLTVSMLLMLMAIGFSAGTQAAAKTLHFIFVPKLVHPWYNDVRDGAEEAAKFLEKATGTKIVIEFVAPPQADPVLHAQVIESAIAKKPDGLAIAVLDESTNTPQINEAIKRGIKTICFDVDAPKSKRIAFVGRNDYVADGAAMAEQLVREIGGKGEVAILIGSPTAPNHQLRWKGAREAFAKYPDVKVVAEEIDNDQLETAVKVASSIIAAHPNLKGMIGVNATAPIGIGRAIAEAGKVGKIKLVGEEDLPEMIEQVKKGIASATLVQRVKQIGWWSTVYLWALNEGKIVPEITDTGTFMVFPKDLAVYKQWQ